MQVHCIMYVAGAAGTGGDLSIHVADSGAGETK